MKSKYIVLVLVLLAVSLSSVYAGNSRRIGTAGATELLIPVGSRGAAMGGAIVSDAVGVEAIYWNPAGLADLEGTEVMFTHQPYLADVDVNYFGLATQIYGFGTIGASAKIVSIGDMEETTVGDPEGTGRLFNPTLSVMSLSYAKVLTANVSFGATAMFINEKISDAHATGMAFDVGVKYDPRWKGVRLGLAIKNYGPTMQFSGDGFYDAVDGVPVAGKSKEFELPSSINMGISYDLLDNGPNFAMVSGNFRSNNFYQDLYQAGAEYVYDGKYSIRGGYNFSDDDNYLYGPSAGLGLIFPLGSTKLSVEYSWTQTEVFDDNQYFTLKMLF
jgi:hypothetical protein